MNSLLQRQVSLLPSVTQYELDLANKKNVVGEFVIDSYGINFLVSQINNQIFTILEQTIKNCPIPIGLAELILIFLNIFHHDTESEQIYLANSVIQIYEQIIEHNPIVKGIKWEDLTHIFMKNLLETDNTYFGPSQSKGTIEKVTDASNPAIMEMTTKLNLDIPTQIDVDNCQLKLFTKDNGIDKLFHKEGIINALYSQKMKKLLSLDINQDYIIKYDPTLKTCSKLLRASQEHHNLDTVILDFALSEKDMRIGAVCRDNTICFWEQEDNFKYEKVIKSQLEYFQYRIWYIESGDLWLTCDKTNTLYSWDLKRETAVALPKAHDAKILDLIHVKAIKAFLVSSLDKKIVVWDAELLTVRLVIPTHNSVHSLRYSTALLHLFTASYGTDIEAWNFDSENDLTLVFMLKGHQSSVTSLALMDEQNLLISGDDSYTIKSWNLYDKVCLQTFRFDTNVKIQTILAINKSSFVTISNRLHLFNFSSINYNQMTIIKKQRNQDDKGEYLNPIIFLEYFPTQNQLIVGTKDEVRLVDITTGKQNKILANLSKTTNDISVYEFDFKENILFYGDTAGLIRTLNLVQGSLQADMLDKHNQNCKYLKIDYSSNLILSVFEDWNIYVQKKDIFDRTIIRELKNPCGQYNQVQVVTASFYLNRIAIATNSVVVLYSYEMLKLQGFCCLSDQIKDIKYIEFAEPYNILIVLDASLKAYIFHTKIEFAIVCFPCIAILQEPSPKEYETPSYLSYTYDPMIRKSYVIFGTNQGRVYVWNIHEILKKSKVEVENDQREERYFVTLRTAFVDGSGLFVSNKLIQQTDWVSKGLLKLQEQFKGQNIPTFQAFDDGMIDDYEWPYIKAQSLQNPHVSTIQASQAIISMIRYISINDKESFIAVGTNNGQIKFYKENGDMITSLKLNLPLPLQWDIKTESSTRRLHLIQKSIQALKSVSKKYGIKTQANKLDDINLQKIFSLTSIKMTDNEAEDDTKSKQNDLLMRDASQKYYKIKNQEQQNKVSLKRLDYDQSNKQLEEYYKENCRLRQTGLLVQLPREAMLKTISNNKKDQFKHKIFKEFIDQRKNVDLAELERLIKTNKGIIYRSKSNKYEDSQNPKNIVNTIVAELESQLDELQSKIELDRKLEVVRLSTFVTQRRTTEIGQQSTLGISQNQEQSQTLGLSKWVEKRQEISQPHINWVDYLNKQDSSLTNNQDQTQLTKASTTHEPSILIRQKVFKQSLKEVDQKLRKHKKQFNKAPFSPPPELYQNQNTLLDQTEERSFAYNFMDKSSGQNMKLHRQSSLPKIDLGRLVQQRIAKRIINVDNNINSERELKQIKVVPIAKVNIKMSNKKKTEMIINYNSARMNENVEQQSLPILKDLLIEQPIFDESHIIPLAENSKDILLNRKGSMNLIESQQNSTTLDSFSKYFRQTATDAFKGMRMHSQTIRHPPQTSQQNKGNGLTKVLPKFKLSQQQDFATTSHYQSLPQSARSSYIGFPTTKKNSINNINSKVDGIEPHYDSNTNNYKSTAATTHRHKYVSPLKIKDIVNDLIVKQKMK